MNGCTELMEGASAGVAPALRAVDCVAGETTAAAFNRLFGAEGAMAPALTLLLTLYIAFFAFSLFTGRSRIGISALTPRMLTLGLVLTFATSWIAYQGVLWNLAVGAPDWIATVLTGSDGSATQIFANRIDIVFAAIGEAGQAAGTAEGGGAEGGAGAGSFGPTGVMWLGAMLLLVGTVGVLLTARIALAILLALGPVFVVLALFQGARGLTAGWLRGVALTALTPLFVVLGGGVTLELMVPLLAAMAQGSDGVTGRAAMALFTMAAVHVALMIMVLKVAGTMVAGWKVFGLALDSSAGGSRDYAMSAAAAPPLAYTASGSSAASETSRRGSIATAGAATASPAHDEQGAGSTGSHAGDRRIVVTQVSRGGLDPITRNATDRARGIGSRFRTASNDTGTKQIKEKVR